MSDNTEFFEKRHLNQPRVVNPTPSTPPQGGSHVVQGQGNTGSQGGNSGNADSGSSGSNASSSSNEGGS